MEEAGAGANVEQRTFLKSERQNLRRKTRNSKISMKEDAKKRDEETSWTRRVQVRL
jgi:hypothetical protein